MTKGTKTTALSLFVLIGVFVLVYDSFSGFGGQKGRILGSLKTSLLGSDDKQTQTNNKLNEISDRIKTLNTRLANIEESTKRSNAKFEKQLIFPEKADIVFSDTKSYEPLVREPKEELFIHAKSVQERAKFRNDMRQLHNAIKLLNRSSVPKMPKIESHRKSKHQFSRKRSESPFEPHHVDFPVFEAFDDALIPLENINPNPFQYPSIPKEKQVKENSAPVTKPIKFSDIIPDLTKEDPIVEVKRFDNYEAFKKYGDDIMHNKVSEADNADDTTYYKMSDIVSSNKAVSPGISGPKLSDELKKLFPPKETREVEKVSNKSDIKNAEATKEKSDFTKFIDAALSDKQKKHCEEYSNPEEAFEAGVCVFKDKLSEIINKKSTPNIPTATTDIEHLIGLRADEKQTKGIEVESVKPQNEQVTNDEQFVIHNQIDKDIQTSYADEQKRKGVKESQVIFDEKSKENKPEETDTLLEMIEKRLPKKDDRIDELIQKPTMIRPVLE